MKKKLSLLMVALVAVAAFAGLRRAATNVTLDFTSADEITAMGFTVPEKGKSVNVEEAFTYKDITITPYAGTTPVRIFKDSKEKLTLRYYKAANGVKGGIAISVPEGNKINQIVITGNTELRYTIADKGSIEMSSDNKTLTWTPDENANDATVKFENNGSSTTNVETITVSYEKVAKTYTATFENDIAWEEVYAYTWTGEGNDKVEQLGEWPGEKIEVGDNGYQLSFETAVAPEKIIFNNGLEGDAQQKTANLDFEDGATYNSKGKVIPLQNFTAMFATNAGWEEVYAYTWTDGDSKVEQLGEWPGEKMTKDEMTGIYSISFDAYGKPANIIFNNGLEGEAKQQTADLAFVDGKKYVYIVSSEDAPLTVTQAVAAIDAGIDANAQVYVQGIVSQVDNFNDGAVTYWISEDGTTANQFEVYKGKGLGGASFNSKDDVEVGANVIISGNITKYGNTYEFNTGSQLVKYEPILKTYIATFATNAGWEEVYAYTWTGEGNDKVEQLGGWPGEKMTKDEMTGIYSISFDVIGKPANIIFNNGLEGEAKQQTTDLYFVDGKKYVYIVSSEDAPLTVTQAVEAIDAGIDESAQVYVQGIVSQVDSYNNGAITYWISTDGTTANQFEVYKGKGLGGASFNSKDDIEVGANVIISGNITKYGNTYEFNTGSQLVTYEAPALPYDGNSSATYVNDSNWEEVYAYTFDPELNGAWPGTKLSKKENQISGYDAYEYSIGGNTAPTKIVFNNGLEGEAKQQTTNYDFVDGALYTSQGMVHIASVSLKGATAWDEQNNWDTNKLQNVVLTQTDENVYSGELNLSAHEGDYQFKLVVNDGSQDNWLGMYDLTLDDANDWVTDVNGKGSNFILDNTHSGYRTYTITATWNPNISAAKKWTLKVEGNTARDVKDYLINYPESLDGITLVGSTMDNWQGLCFYSDYYNKDKLTGNHILLTAEGGFKAGDIVTVAGEKHGNDGTVTIFTSSDDKAYTNIHRFTGFASSDDQTYVLTKDYDKLYLGRKSSSSGWFVSLSKIQVERPFVTPMIYSYSLVGDFLNNWQDQVEMTQDVEDINKYICTIKDVNVTFGDNQNSKTIEFKAQGLAEGAETKWIPEGTTNASYTFAEEGKYTLTFTAIVEGEQKSVALTEATIQNADIESVDLFGSWDSWAAATTLTKTGENVYTADLDLSALEENQEFKLVVNRSSWLGSKKLNIEDPDNLLAVPESTDDKNIVLKNSNGAYQTYTFTATWTPSVIADAGWTLRVEGKDVRPQQTYTVKFNTDNPNWHKIYVYTWTGEGNDKIEQAGAWPGHQIKNVDDDGNFVYNYIAAFAPKKIIFNDGTTEGSVVGKNQTADMEFENDKLYNYLFVPVTITAAKYATYVNETKALDFSATGITAYTAIVGTTSVTLNEIEGDKVPANTPVVLNKADADGTAVYVLVVDDANPVGDNQLVVSDGSAVTNAYVLANKSKGVGFYKWSGGSIPAGKVYLDATGIGAREFLGFEGEATGIANANVNVNVNANCFNLNGQRVAQPTKGLYIVNGRKVVIK